MFDCQENHFPLRTIRSFVKRKGRVSASARHALTHYASQGCLLFQESPYDFETVFENSHPVTLEIGFGMGDSLLTLAKTHPEENFVGIEVHEAGLGNVLKEIHDKELKNLRLISYDAVDVLTHCIGQESLHRVLLFFPDPWPKKRHHKRRLVQPSFVDLLSKKLKPQGIFHVATDWQPYAEHVLEVMAQCSSFESIIPETAYHSNPFHRPPSHYEQRGIRLGHKIWDLGFMRGGS